MTIPRSSHVLSYEDLYGPERPIAGTTDSESEPLSRKNDPLGSSGRAFYGLAGEVVRAIEPHSEADPFGLLLSFLALFGAAVGGRPHALADGARHPARLFVVLVGATAKGRKGSSWAQTKRFFESADPDFTATRCMGGFASAEAVVDAVANGNDERLLLFEPEWARILAVGKRDGSTLSPLLRDAWDSDQLSTRARSAVVEADSAHVCILGHVTAEELQKKLMETEFFSGFANRHLFCFVERSKLLPSGGNLAYEAIEAIGMRIQSVLLQARNVGLMKRSAEAEQLWEDLYQEMSMDEPPGAIGGVISRDSAQVLRLSIIFALTEGSSIISLDHLEAAWAVWQHCRESVNLIFGRSTGDRFADRLLFAARRAGSDGLSSAEQFKVFSRHVTADQLQSARFRLVEMGFAELHEVKTGGRTASVLLATRQRANQAN